MKALCTRETELGFPRDGSKLEPAQMRLWLDRLPACGTCDACLAFAQYQAELEAKAETERDEQLEAGHA